MSDREKVINDLQRQIEELEERLAIVLEGHRCKDCKHGEPGACGDGVDCDGVWHDDDWYCAGWKRKEERK